MPLPQLLHIIMATAGLAMALWIMQVILERNERSWWDRLSEVSFKLVSLQMELADMIFLAVVMGVLFLIFGIATLAMPLIAS